MTIQDYILGRSYYRKNGTHTMLDHTMAMISTVQGKVSNMSVSDKSHNMIVNSRNEHIRIKDIVEKIVVTDISD